MEKTTKAVLVNLDKEIAEQYKAFANQLGTNPTRQTRQLIYDWVVSCQAGTVEFPEESND